MIASLAATAATAATVILCLTTTASAQSSSSSSTTSLFLPIADHQALVASVVGAEPTAVTFAIGCPDGTDSSDCGFPEAWTMTYGKTFFEVQTTESDAFSLSVHCDYLDSTVTVCTESAGGSEANFPGQSTSTLDPTEITSLPVVITAGLEKLAASTSSVTSATGTVSSSHASSTGGSPTSTAGSGSTNGTAAAGSRNPNGAALFEIRISFSLAAVVSVVCVLALAL